MEEERLVMSGFREEEDDQESSLRPKTLREYVGQDKVKSSLNIFCFLGIHTDHFLS